MWFPWDVWFLLRQAYPNPTVPPIGGAHDSGIGDSPNATSPPLRLRATHPIAFSGSRLMAPFTLAVFNRTVSGEYASYEVQQTQAAFLLEKHATARHAHRRDAAKGGPGGSPESKLPQPKLRGALPTHHRVAGLPESTARRSVPPRRATSRVYLGITTRGIRNGFPGAPAGRSVEIAKPASFSIASRERANSARTSSDMRIGRGEEASPRLDRVQANSGITSTGHGAAWRMPSALLPTIMCLRNEYWWVDVMMRSTPSSFAAHGTSSMT